MPCHGDLSHALTHAQPSPNPLAEGSLHLPPSTECAALCHAMVIRVNFSLEFLFGEFDAFTFDVLSHPEA